MRIKRESQIKRLGITLSICSKLLENDPDKLNVFLNKVRAELN